MLTTRANNPRNTANNAINNLLATNPPGYTGGRLAAEQVGGVVSSRVGSRATETDDLPTDSLIARLTAEAQARRDAFGYGEWETGGKVGKLREDWTAVCDRAAAKFGGAEAKDEAMRFARARAVNQGKA